MLEGSSPHIAGASNLWATAIQRLISDIATGFSDDKIGYDPLECIADDSHLCLLATLVGINPDCFIKAIRAIPRRVRKGEKYIQLCLF